MRAEDLCGSPNVAFAACWRYLVHELGLPIITSDVSRQHYLVIERVRIN